MAALVCPNAPVGLWFGRLRFWSSRFAAADVALLSPPFVYSHVGVERLISRFAYSLNWRTDVKPIPIVATIIGLAALTSPALAATATPADAAFVAKVSQGGMFEVEAGKLAVERGATQDIRDFGAMEVHDHELVGAKLTSISTSEGLIFPSKMNSDFQAKLDHLKTLSGPAFDAAYMTEMSTLHAADGAAFAKEAAEGGSPAYRAFGAETHVIVERHIGAIDGAPPP